MKRYTDLTEEEKASAFQAGFKRVLVFISEGKADFFPDLEEEVKQALFEAENNQTPWFFPSILYHEVKGAKEKIDAAVQLYIEDALYPEPGEYILRF